jgi:hypothetical protein
LVEYLYLPWRRPFLSGKKEGAGAKPPPRLPQVILQVMIDQEQPVVVPQSRQTLQVPFLTMRVLEQVGQVEPVIPLLAVDGSLFGALVDESILCGNLAVKTRLGLRTVAYSRSSRLGESRIDRAVVMGGRERLLCKIGLVTLCRVE